MATALGLGTGLAFGGSVGAPALSLDFASMGVNGLDPRITFSRAGNATVIDHNGVMVWAPANQYANSSMSSGWANTRLTRGTANAIPAPVGRSYELMEDTSVTTTHYTFASSGTSLVGETYVLSVYAKALERTHLQLTSPSIAASGAVTFDLDTNVPTLQYGSLVDFGMYPAGDHDWYRCWIAFTATSAGTINCPINMSNGTTDTYTGNGVSRVVISAPQVERYALYAPKPYIETTIAAYYGPRFDHDPATLAPLGLLVEEQRTNFSNGGSLTSTWIGNAATISAGVSSIGQQFTRITANGTLAQHCGQTAWTTGIVGSTAHIVSCFVRRVDQDWIQLRGGSAWDNGLFTQYVNFNLATGLFGTIGGAVTTYAAQYIGDGVYRLVIGVTSKAVPVAGACGLVNIISGTAAIYGEATNTLTTSVDVFGMQVEAGSFATSLIPTFGTSATRAADIASITLSGWWKSNWQGTFVAAYKSVALSASTRVWSVRVDGSNLMQQSDSGGNLVVTQIASTAGGLQTIGSAAYAANTPYKTAVRFDGTTLSIAVNGGAVASGASGGVPIGTPTTLALGNSSVLTSYLNGWISSLRYYPTALPDAQLQALTT